MMFEQRILALRSLKEPRQRLLSVMLAICAFQLHTPRFFA